MQVAAWPSVPVTTGHMAGSSQVVCSDYVIRLVGDRRGGPHNHGLPLKPTQKSPALPGVGPELSKLSI